MTNSQKKLATQYIFFKLLGSMAFIGAIWLYFYRIFITDEQVGILDGIAFAIGIVAEVPSGALADKFGRDKLVKLGQILTGSGILIQSVSSTLPFFIFGQAIMMIGVSFVSGADDALFYQNFNFEKDSTHWRKLVTRGSQAALIGSLIAIIIGGLVHPINPRLPWIMTGIAFVSATLFILPIKDTRPKKVRKEFKTEIKDYLEDIKTGFAQFRLPKLWFYVPLIIAVQGVFYAADFGLLRVVLLDRFQFNSFMSSIVVASCSLITVALLAYLHKYSDKFSEKRIITFIGLAAALSLIFSIFNLGSFGFFVILILLAGNEIAQPIMSEVLNKHAPEEQRATVLSVASFLKTLPYIILAPVIGYLNSNGRLEYFLVTWAIFIAASVMLYLVNIRKDTRIDISE